MQKTKKSIKSQKLNVSTLLTVTLLTALTSGSLISGYLSFVNVVIASLSGVWSVFSLATSTLSYFYTHTISEGVVQISSMVIITAVKLFSKSKLKPLHNSVLTTTSVLLCTAVSSFAVNIENSLIAYRIVWAFLSGCLVYIAENVYKNFKQTNRLSLKGINAVYVSIIYIVFISTLCSVNLFSLNLGRTLGLFCVLLISKKYGIKGGGIVGGITTFAVIMFSPELAKNTLFLTASGVLCGGINFMGTIVQTVLFLLSSILGLVTIGINDDTFLILTDISFASILFVSLPRDCIRKLLNIFSLKPVKILNTDTTQISRVNYALCDIKNRLERISQAISNNEKHTFSTDADDLILSENTSLMRELLTDQLSSTCDLLTDLENNISKSSKINTNLSKNCERIFRRHRQPVEKIFVYDEGNGFYSVEAYLKKPMDADLLKLTVELSEAVGCELEMPVVFNNENVTRVVFTKYALYKLSNSLLQIPCDNNDYCGDSVDRIWLSPTLYVVLLSDGMGTGKCAKLDSAFANSIILRLISSGVSPHTAIKISNSVMRVKGWDESFATVDLALFDLCQGTVTFVKSGSAPSYILRDGGIIKISGSEFPIGILPDVNPSTVTHKLYENDRVILASDGLCEEAVKRTVSEVFRHNLTSNHTSKMLTEISKDIVFLDTSDDVSVFVSQVLLR